MNFLKSFHLSLMLLVLPISLSFAQTSGTTTSQPTSTTSTNRRQELYDQYHGVTKKTTTTPPASTPVSTPVAPSRPATGYSNSQPTTATNIPQRAAPEATTSGVRIGVRGGGTYVFFTEKQPLIKPDIGFVGGLTFNFGAGTFSFQPEINYARYGLKVSDDFTGISIKTAADVIEVPLLLKFSSGTYDGHRFFVNIGPYGSYLASVSVAGKKQPIDSSINRFDFGGALGIGAALKAGPGHVTVEARGMYSFGDTENGFNTDSRVINSQLTVGYAFPLGGR